MSTYAVCEPVAVAPEAEGAVETSTIPPVFRRLLFNTLLTGVTSTFLWFALTFWVYLETRSVVATGVHRWGVRHLVGGARARVRDLRRPQPQADRLPRNHGRGG